MEENYGTLEEMKAAYDEMIEAREAMEEAKKELTITAKKSIVNVLTYGVVAGSATYVVDKIASAYLPKNLKGLPKIGMLALTFLIPEIIGQKAGALADKIMEE